MKLKILFLGLWLITLTGCGLRDREMELEKKTIEVNQKEQELLLKEKSLQIKEEELAHKEKLLDSSSNKSAADSLAVLHPEIPGTWNVTMRCTETTCSGSAVGDTKNEQWVIGYQNNTVIANAISDNKLVRVYTGTFNNNSIELSTQPDSSDTDLKTKMIVRLLVTKENNMTGQREIIRPEDCRIVYSLDLKKQ
jgi:hypothetical protein